MKITQSFRPAGMRVLRPGSLIALLTVLTIHVAAGEVCTTQSQMKAAERDGIVNAALALSAKVRANDVTGLRQQSVPEFAKDYTAMTSMIANTASKTAGAPLVIDQVYLLDASNLKAAPDGAYPDAQFFCSLNNSMAEATFSIPALPSGRFAFAQVLAPSAKSPWSLSFLLRQDGSGPWSMAGFYPRPQSAAGHDGLWYWTQAREQVKEKHLWTGYLLYAEAETLLQPAPFVSSTHLEKLRKEALASAPPALSEGISTTAPLVVKGTGGADFRFTALSADDSVGGDKLYVVAHLGPDQDAEQAASTKTSSPSPKERNTAAMSALLAAYPELRASFGGVWIFADAPGHNPFVTEQAMADIH